MNNETSFPKVIINDIFLKFYMTPKAYSEKSSSKIFTGGNKGKYIWGVLRIAMGAIFLWAFLDKLIGLGFATTADKAWIVGGSPTAGFLEFGTGTLFGNFFQSLAGLAIIDWLFMLGLFFVGVALIFGIGVKLAGYTGALMMFLMWLALLPLENNPIIDDHLIYAIIMVGFAIVDAGNYFGFGKRWANTNLVKKYRFLK